MPLSLAWKFLLRSQLICLWFFPHNWHLIFLLMPLESSFIFNFCNFNYNISWTRLFVFIVLPLSGYLFIFCCCLFFLVVSFVFVCFCFLGLHPRHMGVELELQLLAYAADTTAQDLSHVCDLTTAHGNVRSLTHWVRPGREPGSSWILVGLVSAAPQRELYFLLEVRKVFIRKFFKYIFYPPFSFFSIWDFHNA